MKLAVVPMELEDIPQVLEVDRESYALPWPASAYRREILHNRNARYLVLREVPDKARAATAPTEQSHRSRLPPFLRWPLKSEVKSTDTGHIIGYAGMWLMIDEAHITTIAIRTEFRRRGLGELLLASLVESAAEISAQRVTLEVRVSNEAAQSLYRKYGFRQEGVRPRYYSDDNEDAYIMTTGSIQSTSYRTLFDSQVQALRTRLAGGRDLMVAAPAFAVGEAAEHGPPAD